jgi:protein SCO1/2
MSTTTNRNDNRGSNPKSSSRFILGVAGLLIAVVLLGSGGFLWFTGGRGAPSIGGPFTLVNGDGKVVTDGDFRGKYMLVYFGYTFCPDVCPTTLNAVADAMDKLGTKATKIAPVFITVDPKRDTPQMMKQYTAAFSPHLVGLTGTAAQIADVAKEYRVYYAEHRTGPGPNDYAMDHSSVLYLMGPDGRFVAPIPPDESGGEMAAAISKFIS